jgi:hypothetical protein
MLADFGKNRLRPSRGCGEATYQMDGHIHRHRGRTIAACQVLLGQHNLVKVCPLTAVRRGHKPAQVASFVQLGIVFVGKRPGAFVGIDALRKACCKLVGLSDKTLLAWR